MLITDAFAQKCGLKVEAALANDRVAVVEADAPQEAEVVQPKKQILWIPTAVGLVLLLPTYWLGRRSMLISLRAKMLRERDAYQKDRAEK